MRKNFKAVIRLSAFIAIFLMLFVAIQHIFVPKWYYPNKPLLEPESMVLRGFYDEEPNSLDAIFVGASGIHYGVSPMDIYEMYGIKSYSLATSGQPIAISYYILQEALQTQKPKVVLCDISGLFGNGVDNGAWRYALDSMKFGMPKYNLAKVYIKTFTENSIMGVLSPFVQYHQRWEELKERDFTDFFRNKHFYSKGQYVVSRTNPADVSLDDMNNSQNNLLAMDSQRKLIEYKDNTYTEKNIGDRKYWSNDIDKESVEYFKKIKQLCLDNNIELLMVKVPMVYAPVGSSHAWTNGKYNAAAEICHREGINYIDMQYEADIGIDWQTDTCDKGAHLNILGAEKTSKFLGKLLLEKYDIPSKYDDDWNFDLKAYKQVKEICYLQLENDFINYLNILKNTAKDKVIFISASDEASAGLSENDKKALSELGLSFDFENCYRWAYVAVIESGKVKYEAASNDILSYSNSFDTTNGTYGLKSIGHYDHNGASIIINGTDYSINKTGLNIVVYDINTGIVVDSTCFNTNLTEHNAIRNQDVVSEYLREYENYVIEHTNVK